MSSSVKIEEIDCTHCVIGTPTCKHSDVLQVSLILKCQQKVSFSNFTSLRMYRPKNSLQTHGNNHSALDSKSVCYVCVYAVDHKLSNTFLFQFHSDVMKLINVYQITSTRNQEDE